MVVSLKILGSRVLQKKKSDVVGAAVDSDAVVELLHRVIAVPDHADLFIALIPI